MKQTIIIKARKMDNSIKNIMRKEFASLKKSDPLIAAIELFIKNPDMVFPVVDGRGRMIASVNQHDILKLAIPHDFVGGERVLGPGGIKEVLGHSAKTVGELMTGNSIRVRQDTTVAGAAKIMLDTEAKTLQVVDEKDRPVGFVSEIDILKFLRKELKKK